MRTFIILVIFISIALASYWFQQSISRKIETEAQPEQRFPDYFLEDFSITRMNPQGRPAYTLKASKLLHYADDNSADLERPFIRFNEQSREFTVQAQRAHYLQEKNTIQLYENVEIHRTAKNDQNELSIYTDYLKINTRSRIAETDRPIRITHPMARINAIGLVFNDTEGRLILKSQVKAIYDTSR